MQLKTALPKRKCKHAGNQECDFISVIKKPEENKTIQFKNARELAISNMKIWGNAWRKRHEVLYRQNYYRG